MYRKVIVLRSKTTAPQSFQKSFTNEVWATFPPTQITLTVFLCTDISFSTAFLLYCVRFFSEWSVLNHTFLGSCLPIQIGWGGGGGLTHTHTHSISNVRQQARLHKKTKTSLSLCLPNLAQARTLSESFHLSWHPEDSLKEPYVSSASSQQQSRDHHALLSYHANEGGIQTSGLQTDSYNTDQLPNGCTCTGDTLVIAVVGAKFETEAPYTCYLLLESSNSFIMDYTPTQSCSMELCLY